MTYTNRHQSKSYISYRQSHTHIEQQLSTQGFVYANQCTATVPPNGSPRILPLDVNTDIVREPAAQPSQAKGETHHHSTPTRRVKRGSERDIFLNTPSRTSTQRTHTGTQIYSSGDTPGRGVQLYPEHSQPTVAPAERPRVRGVRQDKGVLTNAALASVQPAADTKSIRVQFTNNRVVRSQTVSGARQKHDRITLWGLNPAIKSELEHVAAQEGLSLSRIGAIACEQWLHQTLHDQHEATLYPTMRQLVRDENRALGNRLVFFQMRTAFAAEQSRILITNVLHKITVQMGLPSDNFNELVDKSNKIARKNIIARSPEIKSLMEEWDAARDNDKHALDGKEDTHQ